MAKKPAPYTPEAMQARFDELEAEKAAEEKTLTPLRDRLAALVEKNRAAENEVRAQIIAANDRMFAIDKERGILAKALGGKSLSQSGA